MFCARWATLITSIYTNMSPCRSVEFETLGARRQSDARGGAADTQQALTELLVQARSRNIKC